MALIIVCPACLEPEQSLCLFDRQPDKTSFIVENLGKVEASLLFAREGYPGPVAIACLPFFQGGASTVSVNATMCFLKCVVRNSALMLMAAQRAELQSCSGRARFAFECSEG